jgi:hypothetical protein
MTVWPAADIQITSKFQKRIMQRGGKACKKTRIYDLALQHADKPVLAITPVMFIEEESGVKGKVSAYNTWEHALPARTESRGQDGRAPRCAPRVQGSSHPGGSA